MLGLLIFGINWEQHLDESQHSNNEVMSALCISSWTIHRITLTTTETDFMAQIPRVRAAEQLMPTGRVPLSTYSSSLYLFPSTAVPSCL